MRKNLAKRLFAGALAAAVACTTVIGSDMTALAADKKATATKIAGSTYTTADLIWEDNFNGKELNTKYWNYEAHEPGWVNAEWQSYPSRKENEETGNIYLKDGKLVIQAKKTQNEDGTYSYTSGRVNTQNKVDTKYGRFEARIKMPSGKGFLPAFWMMPTDENLYGQWPKCGEIDITEVHGSQTDTAYSTLHFGEPHTQRQNTYTLKKGDFSEEFHVYACEWEPGEIRFYIDNKLFYTVNDWFTKKEGFDEVTYPAPFDQPYYIILNLAVGGSWVGYPDETTAFGDNAQMVVDYVKVYQKDSYNEKVEKPENTVELRDPDKNGNYVVNSSFTKAEKLNDGKNWEFLLAGTGEASAKISKKALHITTKNAGELDYSVQVVQPNIPIEQGYQYKLSFDAYADESRTMITAVTAPDNGYIRYLNDTKVKLTTKKKSYSYTFDMKSASDPNGRVEFNLGNQGSTAGVHITNVKLVKVKKISLKEAKTVRPDGNYVYNGEFQEGTDRLSYWTVKKVKGASVKVTNTNNVRRLKAVVPSSVKKVSDVTVKQTKIAVKGGKKYVLSFDAKRTGAKDQTLVVKIAGKTFKAKLTSKMKTYKFEFEPKAGTKSATLEFQLGTKGTTYIDNVRIVENGLIINGDFSAGLTGFEAWANNPSDVSYVVDTLKEDSAFCMDINNTGDQDWHIQLKQTGIKLEKGQNYKITFRAKSDLDRNIKFVFQRNGLKRKNVDGSEVWTVYFSDEQIPVTNEWKTYSAVFTMKEDTDADTSMSFNFGAIGGKQITDKHTVCIDDIVLEKTDEKVEEATDEDAEDNLILNGHFTKGLSPFETWAHDSAKMESGVDNNVFYATITKTGTEDWHAQLKQTDINLEKGKYYKFSFRAKSDVNRQIKYAFQKDGNKHNDDWTVYYEKSGIALTKDWQTYTTIFQMKNDTDPESSFSFNLGAVGTLIEKQHTVMIDDVVLVPATEEEIKEIKENSTTSSGGYIYRAPQTQTPGKQEKTVPVSQWSIVNGLNDTKQQVANGVKTSITSFYGGADDVKQVIPTTIPTSGIDDGATYQFKTTITSSGSKKVTVKVMNGTRIVASETKDLNNGVNPVSISFTGSQIKNAAEPISLFSLRSIRLCDTLEIESADTVKIVIEMGAHSEETFAEDAVSEQKPFEISITNASLTLECVSMLKNADFSALTGAQADSWEFYVHEGLGIDASATYSDKKAIINIANLGTSTEQYSDWQIHLKQPLTFVEGHQYQMTCKLSSSVPRQMKVDLLNADAPIQRNTWDYQMKNVTSTPQEFKVTVTCSTGAAPGTIVDGFFRITMGKIKEDASVASTTAPSLITISDVSVMDFTSDGTEIKKDDSTEDDPVTDDNLLNNSDFSLVNDGNASSWEFYANTSAEVDADVKYENNKAVVTIRNLGNSTGKYEDWHIQLKQAVNFVEGHRYQMSYTISSTVDRQLKVDLISSDAPIERSRYDYQMKTVTSSVQIFEETVICSTGAVSGTTVAGYFRITMGKIKEDENPSTTQPSIITISNVSLKDLGPVETTDDGNDPDIEDENENSGSVIADNLLNKEGWTISAASAAAMTSDLIGATLQNGEVKLTITNVQDACTNEWDLMLMNTGLKLEKGVSYKLSYVASATNSWNIKAQFSNSDGSVNYDGYRGFAAISQTDTPYDFTFTMDKDSDETAVLKFLVGCGSGTDSLKNEGNTVITIKDIKLEKVTD